MQYSIKLNSKNLNGNIGNWWVPLQNSFLICHLLVSQCSRYLTYFNQKRCHEFLINGVSFHLRGYHMMKGLYITYSLSAAFAVHITLWFRKNSIIWRSVDCLVSKAKEWRYIFGRNFLSKMKMKACLFFLFWDFLLHHFCILKHCAMLYSQSQKEMGEKTQGHLYMYLYIELCIVGEWGTWNPIFWVPWRNT